MYGELGRAKAPGTSLTLTLLKRNQEEELSVQEGCHSSLMACICSSWLPPGMTHSNNSSWHSLGTRYALGIMLSLLCGLSHSVLITNQRGRYCLYPYVWFTATMAFNSIPPGFYPCLLYGTFHEKCIPSPHSAKLDWPRGWLRWTECRQEIMPVLSLGLRKPHGLCFLTCISAITRTACPGWLGDRRKILGVEPSHPDHLCRSQPRPAGPQTFDKPSQNKQSCLGDHQLTPDASTLGHWRLAVECYRALL